MTELRKAPDKPPSLVTALTDLKKQGLDGDKRLARHLRIRILRNFTCDDLSPFLRWNLALANVSAEVSFGDFNVLLPELLEKKSKSPYDVYVLALNVEEFVPGALKGETNFKEAAARLAQLLSAATSMDNGAIILANSFVPVVQTRRAFAATIEPASTENTIRRLNEILLEHAANNPGRMFVTDFSDILQTVGRSTAINLSLHYQAASPFTHRFLAEWAKDIARSLRANLGLTKKCVVLDCDGTLWGGVIGEDGLEGISLGPDSPTGRIHLDFQHSILDLKRQGVLIALCSKNEEEDVFSVLDNHPHCALKRTDIAAYRINWEDKASNIRALAEELNIGTDSFVFVDDNPVECGLVESVLPEVTVRMVPEKLPELPSLLSSEGLFDKAVISKEDRERTALYRQQSERNNTVAQYTNIQDYIRSLQIWANIREIEPANVARASQLTQKTNQFNLTTKRCTIAEVEDYLKSTDKKAYFLEAGDRFGNLGIVGVALFSHRGNEISLDNLLMSCRALGRKLENVFLSHTTALAREIWATDNVVATYIPTAKNRQVENFLDQHGFECLKTDGSGEKHYSSSQASAEDFSFVNLNPAGAEVTASEDA